MTAYNIQFKPGLRLRLQRSDVPTPGSFANGFAILLQTLPSAAGHLTRCYTPEDGFVT
jgi:hypothetical protein